MGNSSSLLKARGFRRGPRDSAQQTQAQALSTKPLPVVGPFRATAATAGLVLGLGAGARIRYRSLAALLKATPATALLTAQRQRLVVVRTSEASLSGAFERLIAADLLSAPVWCDTAGAERWVGFLDLRDLCDLLLLRYLWRREAHAGSGSGDTTAAATKTPSSHATSSTKAGDAVSSVASDAKAGAAAGAASISCVDFIDDAVQCANKTAPATTAAAPAPTKAEAASTKAAPAAAAAAPGPIAITIESLAERYPWRPLPSTASLYDVACALLSDVRRVPIVDVATEQLCGVITQSAIVAFLASRMTQVSARGHPIRVPLTFNPTANAVAAAGVTADGKAAAAAPKPVATATLGGDLKAGAAWPALERAKSIPEAIATAATGLASAAAATGEAAAAAAASAALHGLELLETGHSEWQVPMHELSLPGASATGEGPAPGVALGSCPVWTIGADTPVVEALWTMSEAQTSSAAIAGADGALVATLSAADLKLYLRSATAAAAAGHGGVGKAKKASFSDALLDMSVLDFVSAVRRADDRAAIDAARAATSPAARNDALAHDTKSHAQVLSVGATASLAAVVHRLAVTRSHKCYVVGATAPFVPLRVISLTDILRFVVASDEAETAATAAAIAVAAAADAATATAPGAAAAPAVEAGAPAAAPVAIAVSAGAK